MLKRPKAGFVKANADRRRKRLMLRVKKEFPYRMQIEAGTSPADIRDWLRLQGLKSYRILAFDADYYDSDGHKVLRFKREEDMVMVALKFNLV